MGFSGTAARGNTVSEKATVLADLNRRWETERLTANFGYYFAQNGTSRYNKEKTEDRIDLGSQFDHFWATKVYSYVNGRYDPWISWGWSPAGGDRTGTSGGNTQRAEQTRTTQSAGNKHGAQQ